MENDLEENKKIGPRMLNIILPYCSTIPLLIQDRTMIKKNTAHHFKALFEVIGT